jgi:F0F1-type ATP synthase assembly protein I
VQRYWKGYGRYGSIGLEFVLSVLVGFGIGYWLDRQLGTGWIKWVGLGFGVITAYRTIWRALQRANQEARRAEERERKARKDFNDPDDKNGQ